LGFFGDARRHHGDKGELEVIEHLGLGRQQLEDLGDVDALTDSQGADVDLDVGRDEAGEHRDVDFAALDVELAALTHTDGGADELDGYVDVDRLVGGDGVEVDVHRLAPALVHLYLLDEDRVDLAGDIEVDEARGALGPERLVEGAGLDADRAVGLAV